MEKINAPVTVRGEMFGGNNLRNYKNKFTTEQHKDKSAYAKFRCGVAPLTIGTNRYKVNRVSVEERLCGACNGVEDEFYV